MPSLQGSSSFVAPEKIIVSKGKSIVKSESYLSKQHDYKDHVERKSTEIWIIKN